MRPIPGNGTPARSAEKGVGASVPTYPVWRSLLRLTIMLPVCVLVIFILGSGLSTLLTKPLASFVSWSFASDSSASLDEDSIIAAGFFMFSLACLAFMPFHLSHARVDRLKTTVQPFFQEDGALVSWSLNPLTKAMVIVPVLETALLFPLLRALGVAWIKAGHTVASHSGNPTQTDDLRESFAGEWLIPLVVGLGTFALLRWFVTDKNDRIGPFVAHRKKPQMSFLIIKLGFVYVIYMTTAFMIVRGNKVLEGERWFGLVITVCLVGKSHFIGFLEFVSFLLDRRNDNWVQSLNNQATADANAERRSEAAEKLDRLGKWATPAQTT